ncbi:MAG TPA: PAS domain-containing protein [Candidatus Acidoferrum sp.]|nr:PAS domain-containing protein [Candidatus Acidoferrum sp.]
MLTDRTLAEDAVTEAALQAVRAQQTLILGLLRVQRSTSDPELIMRSASAAVGAHLQADRAGFFEMRDEDTLSFTVSWTSGRLPQLTGVFPAAGMGAGYLAEVRAGGVVGISDTRSDPLTANSIFPEIGAVSMMGVPIIRNGRWHAGFYVHHSEVREWTAGEVGLLRDVGEQAWDAVERVRAEAAVRQQWHTFDTALSHIQDFTYTFDLQGRITYANRAFLSRWKKTLAEVVGKTFAEINYPPDVADRLQDQIQHVIRTGTPVRDHLAIPGPTGASSHREYILVPVFGADQQVEAVAGSSRDITERKRLEDLLQEDRQRWRDLLLQAPASISVLRGPEHRFEWVNQECVRLLGRSSADQLLGNPVAEAIPELAPQGYLDLLDRVYHLGQPHFASEALVMLGEPGTVLREMYVNFVCTPTRNSLGQVDGIFVHSSDVTGLVNARKQLEESERQFRTLADSIPHLAWMANSDGHIFWYNRRWYEYTGTRPGEMEGWGWQKVHDPDVLPQVIERWKLCLERGEPFEMVLPIKGANGQFRQFLTRTEPVKDSRGKVVRWFGTATDITAQRRTEEQLRRANRELEEFAYVASHDLQEPLRMVSIYTHLILRGPGYEDPAFTKYAGFVRQGVARMEALINDLLTFSRTAHTVEQPVGTADLSAALGEAISVLRSRIDESRAIIVAPALPRVRGETNQLAHVFQNLLSNSLKYRNPQHPPEIRISVLSDGDRRVVAVRDNGIGFDQQHATRIFGLFKRLHRDEYPGTGLGLAICQRIVERYGGRIWAESKSGEGATFYLCLPAAEDS